VRLEGLGKGREANEDGGRNGAKDDEYNDR
jgi:hypothetical protein